MISSYTFSAPACGSFAGCLARLQREQRLHGVGEMQALSVRREGQPTAG
jgi:hypothetical protein